MLVHRKTQVWGWSVAVVVIVPLSNILDFWCRMFTSIVIGSCAWVSERGTETVGGAGRGPYPGKLWTGVVGVTAIVLSSALLECCPGERVWLVEI